MAVSNTDQDQGLSALDPGEREAILLSDEIGAEGVLLDERAARNAADRRGVPLHRYLPIRSGQTGPY